MALKAHILSVILALFFVGITCEKRDLEKELGVAVSPFVASRLTRENFTEVSRSIMKTVLANITTMLKESHNELQAVIQKAMVRGTEIQMNISGINEKVKGLVLSLGKLKESCPSRVYTAIEKNSAQCPAEKPGNKKGVKQRRSVLPDFDSMFEGPQSLKRLVKRAITTEKPKQPIITEEMRRLLTKPTENSDAGIKSLMNKYGGDSTISYGDSLRALHGLAQKMEQKELDIFGRILDAIEEAYQLLQGSVSSSWKIKSLTETLKVLVSTELPNSPLEQLKKSVQALQCTLSNVKCQK